MLLQVSNADVSYGERTLIRDISFEVRNTEKIAIVGRNGCGKTTFLKLLSGEILPDKRDGNDQPNIAKAPGLNIGWLSQMTFTDDSACLGDEIRKVFLPVLELKTKLDALLAELDKAPDEKKAQEYATLEERFNYLGGYRYEKDYELVFERFGFAREDEARPLSEFSGGQRTKIAFIKLLLSKPDILILDEPTNHLDISTIGWLEGYIREYPRAVIVVSHDRLFLDRVADVVYEIEHEKMTRYVGNYSDFVKRKKDIYDQQKKAYEAQQKEIARIQAVADRFIHKATKATMAKSKLKAIEHMDIIEAPEEYELKAFHALTVPSKESGFDVLDTDNLGFGYDSIIGRLTCSVKKGQKVGIIGGNGLGKSTFLKTLAGKLPLKSGKFKFGHGVEPGYFDQQMAQYVSDKNVLNDFWDIYPYLTETEVRNILGGFLFTGDDVFKEVSLLSGGEKVRLALAKIFETRPNLLLLDEPTNHMDIVGKEALEQMLKDYEGTLIFVTHDRYLVREVADALIVFSGDGIKWFPWNYEEYERSFGKEKQDAAKDIWNIDRNTSEKKTEAAKESGEQQKPAINIGKEKSRMERRIAKIESLLAENDTVREELTLKLADPSISSDYVKLGEIQKAIDDLDKNDEDLMSEWERLSGELENLS